MSGPLTQLLPSSAELSCDTILAGGKSKQLLLLFSTKKIKEPISLISHTTL